MGAITEIAKEIIEMGAPDPTTITHHFASGCYVRECFIPAGTAVVGKIHKLETINILLRGTITIIREDDSKEIMHSPKIFTTPAGSRKAVFTHTDTIFLNVHTSEGDDLHAIEQKYIADELMEVFT